MRRPSKLARWHPLRPLPRSTAQSGLGLLWTRGPMDKFEKRKLGILTASIR